MKFYHKDMIFEVPESVYYPREDSLLLAAALDNVEGKCLDMGCGCGLLAIMMAKNGCDVTAVDINPEAVRITKLNAATNDVYVKCVVSDMFTNVNDEFDLIVFNAPYLPAGEDEKSESDYYGGLTGRVVIERFLAEAKNHLAENGKILLLFSTLSGEKEITTFPGFSKQELAREKIPWEELVVAEFRCIK